MDVNGLLGWDAAKEAMENTKMRARLRGIAAQMDSNNFRVEVDFGKKVIWLAICHSNYLSCNTVSM